MQLSVTMKKLIEKYTLPAIIASCIIFLAILVLEELFHFAFGAYEVIIYTLFSISLSLFIVLVFILVRKKKYETLKKRITGLITIMVLSTIAFLILVRLDLAYVGGMGAGSALVFVYGLFPFTLFMFICSWSILLYKKQFKIAKRTLLEFLLWVIFLVGYIYLNIIFLR